MKSLMSLLIALAIFLLSASMIFYGGYSYGKLRGYTVTRTPLYVAPMSVCDRSYYLL